MMLKQNAQAVTELAILGALVIAAFSYLINYSEKLNRQQANIQQTFRAALLEAGKADNSAAYTKRAFQRLPNVASPMELGALNSVSDSANVLWADGKDRDDVYYHDVNSVTGDMVWRLVDRYPHSGVAKYQFNDKIIDMRTTPEEYDGYAGYDAYGNKKSIPPLAQVPETTTESIANAIDATTTLTQTGSGGIDTRKNFTASDTLTATVYIDVDADGKKEAQSFTHHLGSGGKYSSGGSVMSR
jgi:hypothetical protein